MRSQAGFALIESIVALFLLGTVVLALVGGVLAAVRSSATAHDLQRLDSSIASYSERIKAQQPYVPCAPVSNYTGTNAWKPPSDITIEVSIEYWDGSVFSDATPCVDRGAQRLTLKATLADATTSSTGQIVKGDR